MNSAFEDYEIRILANQPPVTVPRSYVEAYRRTGRASGVVSGKTKVIQDFMRKHFPDKRIITVGPWWYTMQSAQEASHRPLSDFALTPVATGVLEFCPRRR